jgi:hypothetical protein
MRWEVHVKWGIRRYVSLDEDMKVKDHFEDLRIAQRVILKWLSRVYDVMI